MVSPIVRASVPLSRYDNNEYNWPEATYATWQHHVDAGRIGNPVAPAPEVVERRTAMIQLFAAIARDTHR